MAEPSADPRLAMVAGEASGDLLAGMLLGALKTRWPLLQAFGVGGPNMVSLGFDPWWPSQRLAVRGYVEVLRHYRGLSALRKELATRLLSHPPEAFIGIDAPDFNLGLEERLRQRGIRTLHFVCPSIWAWRGHRVHRMARSASHVLCLFPFEPALLESHGVPASYVGHPLADAIPLDPPRQQARAALNLSNDETVIALLPGSRRSEIQYIAPTLLEAASRLAQRRSGLRFLLPVAPGVGDLLKPMLLRQALPGLSTLVGRSHEALAACDLTLIASGTATLEAALFKRPMVIAYRMHPLSWQLMRRMAYQPWVGLPNILSRSFVVPELLQNACTPEALADAAERWLDDRPSAIALAQRFHDLHLELRCDTARRATEVIARELGRA